MSNLEMKVDALMRLVTSEDSASYDEAKAEVLRLMNGQTGGTAEPQGGIVDVIEDMLTELGMPSNVMGFDYNVEAVRLAVEDKNYVIDITKALYPAVAKKFGTTPSRTERAMRHAIETTWDRGDTDQLDEYFGNSINPNKGKPTNSEFVARMAILIRRRLNGAA